MQVPQRKYENVNNPPLTLFLKLRACPRHYFPLLYFMRMMMRGKSTAHATAADAGRLLFVCMMGNY